MLEKFTVDTAPKSTTTHETRPAGATSITKASRSLRILLAEDNLVNQKYASRLLEKRGHTVTIAENGRKAAEIFQTQPVDLILMDIQMPEMDGFEATSWIRQLERKSGVHTPIIAMTAHAMKGDRERCLDGGMDGYIPKPVPQKELLSEIERVLQCTESIATKTKISLAQQAELPVFDYADAVEQIGCDELLNELLGINLAEIPKLIAEISEAIRDTKCEAVARSAHKLKGSMGLICARRACAAAFDLERVATNEDLAQCDQQFADLRAELEELHDALVEVLVPDIKQTASSLESSGDSD